MLNESMYTATGAQSLKLMKENPNLFQLYHVGYAEQVKRWPSNPLDDIIAFLRTQPKTLRVADLGCGEARLAEQVPQTDVKSFDLVAVNERVTECDIAHVPLPDSSVDIAVFCLSLMGTNYGEFIQEARRILVPNGLLLVAEVASRFEEQDPSAFVVGIQALGFREDRQHPMVQMGLPKSGSGEKRRRGGRKKGKRDKQREMEHALSSAVFFLKFAFGSTKKEVVDSGEKKQSGKMLPKLGACVYKKR